MEKQKIAKIILSKVLEMPLIKYLYYIEKTTNGMTKLITTNDFNKKKPFYAKVIIKDSALCFVVPDSRLTNIYFTENCTDNKTICSLKWINTRNEFSLHILKSLLHHQSKYWFSGKESGLRPLSLKIFLSLYPLRYLDQSRLSRLIPNLSIISPQNKFIDLESVFISKRKYHSHLVKEVVDEAENALRDKDIQCALAQKGIHLSLRTICNCRKLRNIPNYRESAVSYYGKDLAFSDYIRLSKRHLNKIPNESGVYELSISGKIDYLNKKSNVIYIGASKNLKKRISSYLNHNLKNKHLDKLINDYDTFIRYCLTEDNSLTEKILLKNFKNKYGECPRANMLGG